MKEEKVNVDMYDHNTVLNGLRRCGKYTEMTKFLEQIHAAGLKPSDFALIFFIKKLSFLEEIIQGMLI
jgi:pentatricopeptide repeat protein